MVSLFDGYNHILRLDRGERLREMMEQFFAAQDVQGAWVSGIGGVTEVEIGFYDLDAQVYRWRRMTQILEITSLQGTIALDERGRPGLHLHGTFGDHDYRVVGGHVKDFVVGGTCELFIHRIYQPLHRAHDDKIGLDTLSL